MERNALGSKANGEALAFTGKKVGMIKHIEAKIKENYPNYSFLSLLQTKSIQKI